jgi:FtsZ-binding cell division protein ZapB
MKAQLRIHDIAGRDEEEYTSDFLDAEIEDLKHTSAELTTEYQSAVDSRNEVKQNFDKEKDLSANSKADGQSVRERIEAIMKEIGGINVADFHVKEMQGGACRMILGKRDAILAGIQDFVLGLPEAQKQLDRQRTEFEQLHRGATIGAISSKNKSQV